MDLKKLENENEEKFLWRLGQAKDNGQIDLSWDEIANIMNREFNNDDRPLSEAAYRRPYQHAKKFFESGVFNDLSEDRYIQELQEQKLELAKQTVKIRDERNELSRVIREEARKESYKEQFLRTISDYVSKPLEYDCSKVITSMDTEENDLIISLMDVHAGIEIDNYFNKFNEDILKDRFNNYLKKITTVMQRHKSQNVYVVISELVSGIIHNELRIENNKNLIEQFLLATDYTSQFLSELSYLFENVYVYVCPGNHGRISPKKEDSLKGENIEHLILPFLEAKLQNHKNIVFNKNDIEESIVIFSVRNHLVMATHGDKDTPNNVVQKFTLMFGMRPHLVYMGHRHTNGYSTVYDTKVIQSGCMSGSDNYCMDLRLKNRPEQTISVVTDGGLECLYDVKF